MKKKGIMLVLLGIAGIIFVCAFDSIMKKPVNDISGPKSITALIICAVSIAAGVYLLLRKQS